MWARTPFFIGKRCPRWKTLIKLIRTVQGRFLQTLTPQSIVRVVGCCDYFFDREYGRMLTPDLPLGQLFSPGRQLPLPGDPAHELDLPV